MAVFDAAVERTDLGDVLNRPDYHKEIFDASAKQSGFLSRARRLPNMTSQTAKMDVMNALPIAYWVSGDTGLRQTTNVSWTGKTLTAEELAVIVPIPSHVIDDSKKDGDIQARVLPQVSTAIAKAIDQATLFGTGKPSSWPAAILTTCGTAGHTKSLAAATDMYEALLDDNGLLSLVEQDGYMVNGSIAHPVMLGKMRGTRDANGQPILMGGMANEFSFGGYPISYLENGAMDSSSALMFVGDWNQAVWAFRDDLRMESFDQGVVQDGAGNIVWNLLQQRLVAIMVTVRMAWQIANPISWLNETEATRYPFAALIP